MSESSVDLNIQFSPSFNLRTGDLVLLKNAFCLKRHCKNNGKNLQTVLPACLYKYFDFGCHQWGTRSKTKSAQPQITGPFAICLNHFNSVICKSLTDDLEWPEDFHEMKKIFTGRSSELMKTSYQGVSEKNCLLIKNLQQQPVARIAPNLESCQQPKYSFAHSSPKPSTSRQAANSDRHFEIDPLLLEPEDNLAAHDLAILFTETPSRNDQEDLVREIEEANFLEEFAPTSGSSDFNTFHQSSSTSSSNIPSCEENQKTSNYQDFVKTQILPNYTYFQIEKPNPSELNYFGVIDLLVKKPNAPIDCFLFNVFKKHVPKITFLNSFWCKDYEKEETFMLIGTFGEVRNSKKHPNFVSVKRDFDISAILELEMFKKSTKSPFLFLPKHITSDKELILHVYQIEEICSNLQVVKKKIFLTQPKCCYVLREVLKGLEFLHSNQIIHRDICLENIFIYGNKIQIGQFHLAVLDSVDLENINKFNLKFPYCSPEQVGCSEKKTSMLTNKTDIWAIGCLFADLISNSEGSLFKEVAPYQCTLPYEAMTNLKLENMTLNSTPPKFLDMSEFNFIQNCVNQTPSQRPSANEIIKSKCLKYYTLVF